MPRQTQSTSTQKPSLPYRVTYMQLGATATDKFDTATPAAAVKFAKQQLQSGARDVAVIEHNGEGWVDNEQLTQRAIGQMKGIGNTHGATMLQQLSQYNEALAKKAASKNGFSDADVKEWLQQFGLTCKAMGVTGAAINEVLGSIYQPQEA